MKKFLTLLLIGGSLSLVGCGQKTEAPTDQQPTNIVATTDGIFAPRERTILPTRKMEKPDISEMENREAITQGFNKPRTSQYTFTDSDAQRIQRYCDGSEDRHNPALSDWYGHTLKTLKPNEVIAGNTVDVNGTYQSDSIYDLSPAQQQQIATRGRTITDLNSFKERWYMNYSEESDNRLGDQEERNQVYQRI